jgi:hypothetical protein
VLLLLPQILARARIYDDYGASARTFVRRRRLWRNKPKQTCVSLLVRMQMRRTIRFSVLALIQPGGRRPNEISKCPCIKEHSYRPGKKFHVGCSVISVDYVS